MESKVEDMSISALCKLITETDKRYEQRFVDLDRSKDTAFNAANTIIREQKTAMETAFIAAEKVSNKTEKATEDRFKAMDTLLEQIRVQAMTFIPRLEWQITTNNFSESIKKMGDYQAQAIGAENYGIKSKSNTNMIIVTIISAVVALVSIVTLIMKH